MEAGGGGPMSKLGMAGKVAHAFIESKLTPLVHPDGDLLGVGAVLVLPREEEPQIIVPMIDVFVQMPGASAKEVEERVTKPMEKLIWEVPGVEYVYSTSSPGFSMAVVRFLVGQDEEKSIVRLNQKMFSNFDLIPPGASQPLIKPRYIDDVPILAITLWSERYDHYTLRRIAAQLDDVVKAVDDVSSTTLIGGQRRQLRVTLDPSRLNAYHLTPLAVLQRIQQENQSLPSGSFSRENREFLVETGGFFQNSRDVENLVVADFNQKPVYLRDVAQIIDGAEEPSQYVFFGAGPAAETKKIPLVGTPSQNFPAVTLSIAKRKGTNAVTVAEEVLKRVESYKGTIVPGDVHLTVTRHYGETAAEKSNELLFHMAIAVFSVTLLIWIILGFREAGVVAVAIPVTLALTLAVFYLYGYTLNRITLFALIFSIGILVDDAIVVVENIVRHYRLAGKPGRRFVEVAVEAVDEVGNPTILATFAVIAAIIPMAFVRGLMGPYMRPIPVGASAAMLFSLAVAFIVTPWASLQALPPQSDARAARDDAPALHGHSEENWSTRLYRKVMGPLIHHASWRWGFLIGVVLAAPGCLFTGLYWICQSQDASV